MKHPIFTILVVMAILTAGCGSGPSPTDLLVAATLTSMPPSPTLSSPTTTSIPEGRTIVVTSTEDSGPGTFRQALLDAQSGDIITFDPAVFPPKAPVAIYIDSQLPHITQGGLTIDASNAGVILDGSALEGEWTPGLAINSEGNTIQGLQVINFSGAGITLENRAHHNTIGGDRSIGSGPIGQGNLSSGNSDGIGLYGASDNIITGNLIGTDITGTEAFGNQNPGIFIQDGASHNVIGSNNIIAHNGDYGIDVRGLSSIDNTFTHNSIHSNAWAGINVPLDSNTTLQPIIFEFDLEAGIVAGLTCPECIVEVFSNERNQGEVYEGRVLANDSGSFTFNKGAPFTLPQLTATSTSAEGSTSEFSISTSGTRRSVVLQDGNLRKKYVSD